MATSHHHPAQPTGTTNSVPRQLLAPTLIADFAIVAAFAIGGRRTHADIFNFTELAKIAWPFLIALAAGWIVASVIVRVQGASPAATLSKVWPSGIIIWLLTWLGGIGVRIASGDTADGSFPIVTGLFLFAGLIGWRLVALLFRRRDYPTAA